MVDYLPGEYPHIENENYVAVAQFQPITQIGQRVSASYSELSRIFLAGDAVHTHSPKAGQGMNVSMADTYNLGWKLGSVLNGTVKPSILSTYETERREVALQLIELDTKFAYMFSGRPSRDMADEAGISMKEFKRTFEENNSFTSGLSVRYGESSVVAQESEAKDSSCFGMLTVGMRFPSCQVLCQSDATPRQTGDLLTASGSWRLFVFAGDVIQPPIMKRLHDVADKLEAPTSIIHKCVTTPAINLGTIGSASVLQPILIHSSPRKRVEFLEMPKLFYERFVHTNINSSDSVKKEYDYYRIFADDESYHHGHGKAYETYGIDQETGRLVVVRPDQYVSWMGKLGDVEALETFLKGIMSL